MIETQIGREPITGREVCLQRLFPRGNDCRRSLHEETGEYRAAAERGHCPKCRDSRIARPKVRVAGPAQDGSVEWWLLTEVNAAAVKVGAMRQQLVLADVGLYFA